MTRRAVSDVFVSEPRRGVSGRYISAENVNHDIGVLAYHDASAA